MEMNILHSKYQIKMPKNILREIEKTFGQLWLIDDANEFHPNSPHYFSRSGFVYSLEYSRSGSLKSWKYMEMIDKEMKKMGYEQELDTKLNQMLLVVTRKDAAIYHRGNDILKVVFQASIQDKREANMWIDKQSKASNEPGPSKEWFSDDHIQISYHKKDS